MEQATKRRSRILAIQKKNLVSLVQNFFLRTVGSYHNVNFDDINLPNWERIAFILNSMGPSKSKEQWKTSFYFMTNRIRKKVELVRQCGAHPKDNLSDLDYAIYEMSPTSDYVLDEVFDDPEYTNAKENQFDAIQPENSHTDLTQNAVDDSNHVLVVRTIEELEAYMNEPMIEEESETAYDYENGVNVTDELGVDEPIQDYPENIYESRSRPSSVNLASSAYANTRENREEQIGESQGYAEEFHATTHRLPINQVHGTIQSQRTVSEKLTLKSLKSNKSVGTAKTSVRIPEIQKERLVQLIQNNFLKAVGRFAGANGTYIKSQLWTRIANELNTLGPPRTAEQWKTTFNYIKAGAKAKLADDHNNFESVKKKNLTRLEEKIVSIYGMDNMDGQQSLGESGFQYEKTVPVARHVDSVSANSKGDDNVNSESNRKKKATKEAEEAVLRELIEEIWNEPDENGNMADSQRPTENVSETPRPPPIRNQSSNSNSVVSEPTQSHGNIGGITGRANSRPVNPQISEKRSIALPSAEEIGNEPDENWSDADEIGNMAETIDSQQASERHVRNQILNSRPAVSQTTGNRGNIGRNKRVSSRPINRQISGRRTIVPPRARRNARESSPMEYVTNINQLFNDNDDESDSNHTEDRNIDSPRRNIRDRSNLRNKHTSYEMVQSSMSAQDRLIEDSRRNHSEMLFLNDRNHLEIVGMFTSTLSAFVDVAKEFVNKM